MNHMRIAVAALALVATACSSEGPDEAAHPTSSQSPASSDVSVAAGAGLTDVKPCELITRAEAAGLGIVSPRPRRTAGLATCEWDGNGRGGLTVAVDGTRGVGDLDYAGDTKAPARFGTYEGFSVAAPGTAQDLCHAVISVSDSSTVQVVASGGGASTDTAKACELATTSAELIAAKLP